MKASETDQLQAALATLTPMERAALAVKLELHERTLYRWATGAQAIKKVYIPALREALGGKK